MTYVAEFTVPPEAFPFGKTLAAMPDAEIEVDQIIPTDESALPFFWVRGCEPDAFMEHAEAEPEVRDTRKLESVKDTALFRAEWRPNTAIVGGLRDLNATIVESIGTANSWRFEVRTENREAFTRFREVFVTEGVPVDLVRVYDLEDLLTEDDFSLTENQREVLLAALEAGYFDTPRGTTQEELAGEFDVSPRAVSERLRRGTRNLVEHTLSPDGEA